ncbi:MAG TPA: serine/threonine-protein kinase [Opitutaceae bacterium]|jgi:serine/threonine protein kinase|nr:serine/threonine-protein kinase [Opitutaceae bacterium]
METLMIADPPSDGQASAGGELTPGMVLDGRFDLIELVARSNMASIFKAYDLETHEAVAIKVPLLSVESDLGGYERFKREEEIGLSLDHPSILKFIKVEGEKSRRYIVMEFFEGETLAERMARIKPMPENEAARIVSGVCDALDYLYRRGIVHRDLKPQNIILCRDGSLRLIDFGLARAAKSRRLTFAGLTSVMGTPDYIAPEQVKGKRGDHQSDVYSLGAILYEMVTGTTPFEGENPYVIMNMRLTGDPQAPRALNPSLTPVMEEIILHAMERNPSQRYLSALVMKRELDNCHMVDLTNRHLRLRAPQPWKTKLPLWKMIAGLVLLQVVLFFLLLLHFKSHH